MFESSFDDQFLKIKELTWYPWIGLNYNESNKKILIVGDSHYHKNEKEKIERGSEKGYTRRIINDCPKSNLWKNQTFKNLNKLLNISSYPDNKWNSIAFYNFIQRTMNYSSRIPERPSDIDMEKGCIVFSEVLKTINPEICIFLGVSSFEMIISFFKKTGFSFTNINFRKINKVFPRVIELNVTKIIQIIFIKHPSKFFSWKKWQEFFKLKCPSILE
jgi:hypothetical protein